MVYATVEQANSYHAARLSSTAWAALSAGQKAIALQSASDAIDQYAAENGGWKTQWTAEADTPVAVQRVCCEEALRLTDTGAETRREMMREGVKATSIGGASESYAEGSVQLAQRILRCPGAAALLKPYLGARKVVPIR